MVSDARTGTGAAAYRGFLFSDLRGFTAYAERHGNTAAANAVARFLDIARTAIARHDGAEIKTEGDAIHAVFPSASSAVLCGLEIQDAAAELNAKEPERPLGLGVGVHAGEAVETAEGYIGRAVNIAARLCAAARPGEVLVSSTVKGITQSSITVGFIPRGRRRLKGIEDPIEIYAVTRDTSARRRRPVRRPMLFGGAGLAIAAVIAIAVIAASTLLGRPGASPSASTGTAATGRIQPVQLGRLPIGTYESRVFQPPVRFDIPDPGWTADEDSEGVLGLLRDAAPTARVQFLRVQEVIGNPCIEGGEGGPTGPGAADLLAQLQALKDTLTVSEPQTVRIGGFTGRQVDVSVATSALAACGGPIGGGASIFRAGGDVWRATPGERFRLTIVGVGEAAVTIIVSTDWTKSPSVQELESVLDLGRRVVDTVRF